MPNWVDDRRASGLDSPPPSARTRPAFPRAIGTQPMVRIDLSQVAVAVFADDSATRARICDLVRAHDFVPLPLATGLDAVLTLERASPRLAIVAHALGAEPDQIVDFLADEHPAIEVVLLAQHADARLARRVSAWMRDLSDLDGLLRRRTARQPRLGRVLILATYAPLRRAVCEIIAELGWDAVSAGRFDEAERALASGGFDAAIVEGDRMHTGLDYVAELRRIAPGLPAIILGAMSPPLLPPRTLVVETPSVASLTTALQIFRR